MGDRTNAWVTCFTKQKDQLLGIFGTEAEFCQIDEQGEFTVFHFEEVNYAELSCMEDLETCGVALDYEWSSGGDYTSGKYSYRFTSEGEFILTGGYDDQQRLNLETLTLVINLPDSDSDKLALLVAEIEAANKKWTPIPFDEAQIQNGNIFRVNKLIE
jgi:hypothetical protein